ncbi:MAG: hypothetical protein WC370_03630 [Dehalococcoidales bacterium]|jgi:hypothetical protein
MKNMPIKANTAPIKGAPGGGDNSAKAATPKAAAPKPPALLPSLNRPAPVNKTVRPQSMLPGAARPAASTIKDDFSSLKEAAQAVRRIKISAQQERDEIRKMRADALRFQQDTATRARSEAHQLILHSRLETQREIEELIRQASEEIQKVLADIRVIRITAQEELAAQRKFTDAAKLNSMSLSIKEDLAGTERKKKRQMVSS